MTTRPGAIEVERINDSKLSLGAENAITMLLANRGQRPIRFQLREGALRAQFENQVAASPPLPLLASRS